MADTLKSKLQTMRQAGWFVAVHNDYKLNGWYHTFYLFTNPSTGRFIKGEGRTDEIALDQCISQLYAMAGAVPPGD